MEISSLLRENIKNLVPYSTARSEFGETAEIYLDANENNYGTGQHRYPDPYQRRLKLVVSELKNVSVENIFVGHGSDEIIDLIIRAFCNPGKDSIICLDPSYGMYAVSAAINDVAVRTYPLDENFEFDVLELCQFFTNRDKVLFICNPNNPSGNVFKESEILSLITTFQGIVVIDEAYIDFSGQESFTGQLLAFPNLIILQTLSKSYGAASLRIGLGFMSAFLVDVLHKIKPPYNISGMTEEAAIQVLQNKNQYKRNIKRIIKGREWFSDFLLTLDFVESVYPSRANFILFKVNDAIGLYKYLLGSGVVVRDRSKIYQCQNCLRITIGTDEEMEQVKYLLRKFKSNNI
ncbi:MAG: histidinol-phosphate transaminase [Saprospiraceae bacterium]|nr:histidinol-phosphate transaminase [Saprospiraceae bacterium]